MQHPAARRRLLKRLSQKKEGRASVEALREYIASTLPRAPLPRQTGGAHKVLTKVLPRKAKHKKREEER